MFKANLRLAAGVLAMGMLLTATTAPVAAHESELFSSFTITSATVDQRTGEIAVSGTATCAATGNFFLDVGLRQTVGRFVVYGWAGAEVQCSEVGQVVEFTARGGSEGKLTPGRARLAAFAWGICTEFTCEGQFLGEMSIRLRRA